MLARGKLETMAADKGQTAVPAPLLGQGVKNFLEGFKSSNVGLRAGRKLIRTLYRWRDPVRRKLWISRFGLPLRNLMLWNRPLKVSLDGISFFLVPQGAAAGEIWVGLRTKKQGDSFLSSILKPGMVLFDVGANAGPFTICAAKKIGGKGVFAFEPCSSTFELLKRNVQLNRLADVSLVQVALGDSICEGVMQVNARGRDGLNTLGQATHPDSMVVGQETVRITTVDVFVKDHHVPRVDVMKVDIEGAELMMFRGARDLLISADAPLILYAGLASRTRGFGYHPVEILWLLESCGYALYVLNSESGEISELKPDDQYDSMIIAVKPGHPAFEDLRARLK